MKTGVYLFAFALVRCDAFFQTTKTYRQTAFNKPTKIFASIEESSTQNESFSDELQDKLKMETLARITVSSFFSAVACFAVFPSLALWIQSAVHDSFDGASTGYGYEALNLILTDNSNQFIQNIHNALALIFSFLTGNTLFFMYRQQETLYYALFDEVTALTSLIEQSALLAEGREVYNIILKNISKYIEDDLKLVTDYKTIHGKSSSSHLNFLMNDMNLPREDLPSLILSRRPEHDPLENILYITSVGEPSRIYSTVKELRQARARRLGALQRKMPEVNMYLLYVLGFTVWISFPIVAAGSETVGGDALLQVFRIQLSIGVFAMVGLLGIVNELKRPEIASAYNIDYSVLGKLMAGIEEDLERRIEKTKMTTEQNTRKSPQRESEETKGKRSQLRSFVQKRYQKLKAIRARV